MTLINIRKIAALFIIMLTCGNYIVLFDRYWKISSNNLCFLSNFFTPTHFINTFVLSKRDDVRAGTTRNV